MWYVYIKLLSPFNVAHMYMCLEWLLMSHSIGTSHPEKKTDSLSGSSSSRGGPCEIFFLHGGMLTNIINIQDTGLV